MECMDDEDAAPPWLSTLAPLRRCDQSLEFMSVGAPAAHTLGFEGGGLQHMRGQLRLLKREVSRLQV
jgi:hypothetical protein